MSDNISRADSIEAFGLSEKTRKYGGDHSGYDTMMKYEIQDVLENLPSAEAEWISCSERLPKKGEVVLITNGKGNVRCGQYRSEYDVRDGTHYWWWKGKTVESVLAWMPLPKPYREDGEA